MNRSDVLTLVAETYAKDSIGQRIPTFTEREVYCSVCSVSHSEYFSGAQAGIAPQYKVTMFAYDYNGEKVAKLGGEVYGIYRTYQGTGDILELYLEKKMGLNNVENTD